MRQPLCGVVSSQHTKPTGDPQSSSDRRAGPPTSLRSRVTVRVALRPCCHAGGSCRGDDGDGDLDRRNVAAVCAATLHRRSPFWRSPDMRTPAEDRDERAQSTRIAILASRAGPARPSNLTPSALSLFGLYSPPAWPNINRQSRAALDLCTRALASHARAPFDQRPTIQPSSPRPGRGCATSMLKRHT